MSFSRRDLMAGAAGAAALGALPGVAEAKAPLSGKQNASFFRQKVGDFEVTTVNDGFFARPVAGFVKNAMDDEVKAALAAARNPTGENVFIPFTTPVVNTGSKLVLIDCGNGDSGAPTSGTWMSNFRAAGFDPKDVDTIIISHFHGDHINGIRLKNGDAVFPNAEIMVPQAEWAFWMDDARMNNAPDPMKPAFQNVRRVFGPIAKDVKQFESGKEISPGITAIAAPGHTPGHHVYMVSSGNGKLLCLADTTNNPHLFVRNPDWQAIFDMDGAQAAQGRRRLLDMAVTDKLQVHLYHWPFPATGFIEKDGAGFRAIPATWSGAL
jgi:glyoxylase-like metal-dependent hydrolase (beta-lactamase superfamily II)